MKSELHKAKENNVNDYTDGFAEGIRLAVDIINRYNDKFGDSELSLNDVIHEGIEDGKEVSYTMADILMGCRKILINEPPNQVAWNDIQNRITDILVCAGLVEDNQNQ